MGLHTKRPLLSPRVREEIMGLINVGDEVEFREDQRPGLREKDRRMLVGHVTAKHAHLLRVEYVNRDGRTERRAVPIIDVATGEVSVRNTAVKARIAGSASTTACPPNRQHPNASLKQRGKRKPQIKAAASSAAS